MVQTTFTFRVDEDLKENFARLAKSVDRSAAQLLRDHMRDLVNHQKGVEEHGAWFRKQVQIGLDLANAGNLVPSEEVEAKFSARRTETRRKLDQLS
ncbi:MAG: hypothetical protein F4Z15_10995 [Gammaproteobacteria bacterium]|nr:hypothetical protein [Gammaproteobacteria bacterium]MYD75999.1 hypothetical protein [Gammaproteobacteria bacterium]MYJ51253.1 hypothetical protein [Gammaproteobacteria bacterium]